LVPLELPVYGVGR